ncbi:hypothetical protein, partial [Bacteroides heparinolyticus]|uniref:hypothetical protein n=1 Tax=Prevotella heparinolytica TaxID=28113 RepID=UPI0035A17165
STENASILRIHDLSATFAVTSFLQRVMEWVKPNVPQTTLYHPFLLFIFTQIFYSLSNDGSKNLKKIQKRQIFCLTKSDKHSFFFIVRLCRVISK